MELNKCLEFMKEKHQNQKRKHGTPYYLHPLAVSNILKEKGFSLEYQVAGLFHDLLEDTNATLEEITELSNAKVAETTVLLTKEKGYVMAEYIDKISKNNMARMIKIVDRIHNLSEAHLASIEFQEKYIKETEQWFINLAKGTIFEKDLNNVLLELKANVAKIKGMTPNQSFSSKKIKKRSCIKPVQKEIHPVLVGGVSCSSPIIPASVLDDEAIIAKNKDNKFIKTTNHLVKKKIKK